MFHNNFTVWFPKKLLSNSQNLWIFFLNCFVSSLFNIQNTYSLILSTTTSTSTSTLADGKINSLRIIYYVISWLYKYTYFIFTFFFQICFPLINRHFTPTSIFFFNIINRFSIEYLILNQQSNFKLFFLSFSFPLNVSLN